MKSPYYLKKRGEFWYYRLNPESGLIDGENTTYYTTKCRTRDAAEEFMADLLGISPRSHTFYQYAEPFFVWGQCPHIRRVLEERGSYTERHAYIQRHRLEKHVFGDPFCRVRLTEITRADLFDLRSRLLQRTTTATTNKVMDLVKIILREAVVRDELKRDPTEMVRRVRHDKQERGTFTVEEMKVIEPAMRTVAAVC